MTRYGYAYRALADFDVLERERDELEALQCDRIIVEGGVKGPAIKRPGLSELLEALTPGDQLMIRGFDRLSRRISETVPILRALEARGVAVLTLDQRPSPEARMIVKQRPSPITERSVFGQYCQARKIQKRLRRTSG